MTLWLHHIAFPFSLVSVTGVISCWHKCPIGFMGHSLNFQLGLARLRRRIILEHWRGRRDWTSVIGHQFIIKAARKEIKASSELLPYSHNTVTTMNWHTNWPIYIAWPYWDECVCVFSSFVRPSEWRHFLLSQDIWVPVYWRGAWCKDEDLKCNHLKQQVINQNLKTKWFEWICTSE